MGFEQVVLTNVQFPKLSRKQDYGETSGVSRADQLKADIAALQSRFAGSMTLWFSYTLDQCNTNSVSLDVPAVTLGMDNLLVTADKAMDAIRALVEDSVDAMKPHRTGAVCRRTGRAASGAAQRRHFPVTSLVL